MLENLRKKQKIVIIFIAFVFIVGMGIMGLTDIFFNKRPLVGRIDGVKISYEMFQDEFQKGIENYRQQNPDAEINTEILRQLSDQAWQRLTQSIIFGKQLKKLRIKITDDDVLNEMQNNPPQELMQNPALQTNGRFDRKKYLNALKQDAAFFSAIENYMRESLPYKKMMEKVKQNANITLDSLKTEYIKENNEFFGKMIAFDYNKLDKPEVTDTEIKEYYDNNKKTDKEINKGKSTTIKYLIIEVKPSENDFSNSQSEIDDIYNLIQEGEDFGMLARDRSDDTGSAQQFGSLGSFGRGQMVPEFENMAFSMQPGEVSKPFKTQFGWHIIKVEGFSTTADGQEQVQASHILKRVSPSFETREATEDSAKDAVKLIRRLGIEKAAEELKVQVMDTDPIFKDAEFIPGIGNNENLLRFAKRRGVGAVSKVEKDRRGNFLIAQITSKTKDPFVPLEKVKMRIKFDLERQKRIEQMRPIAQNFVKSHEKENFLSAAEQDTLIKVLNLQNLKSETTIIEYGRMADVNQKALEMNDGEISDLIETNNGLFVIICERRVKPDIEAFLKDTDEQKKLQNRMEEQAWNRWYDNVMKSAKIIDNRNEFNLF